MVSVNVITNGPVQPAYYRIVVTSVKMEARVKVIRTLVNVLRGFLVLCVNMAQLHLDVTLIVELTDGVNMVDVAVKLATTEITVKSLAVLTVVVEMANVRGLINARATQATRDLLVIKPLVVQRARMVGYV